MNCTGQPWSEILEIVQDCLDAERTMKYVRILFFKVWFDRKNIAHAHPYSKIEAAVFVLS